VIAVTDRLWRDDTQDRRQLDNGRVKPTKLQTIVGPMSGASRVIQITEPEGSISGNDRRATPVLRNPNIGAVDGGREFARWGVYTTPKKGVYICTSYTYIPVNTKSKKLGVLARLKKGTSEDRIKANRWLKIIVSFDAMRIAKSACSRHPVSMQISSHCANSVVGDYRPRKSPRLYDFCMAAIEKSA
jgi:hypothetical protein